ncbi:unnamed protein product [Choristocarpus tenellus]
MGGNEDEEEEPATFSITVNDFVRFRVRTLNFTEVTTTATGIQATTLSQGRDGGAASAATGGDSAPRVRERGRSVDLTSQAEAPSAMTITGSMNEEGLGLTSWWE